MALAPLATSSDLSARLGRSFTDTELTRATAVLKDVSAAVRRFCGQDFTAAEDDTVRLKVRDGRVRLPQHPVNDVTAVADMDGNAVVFTWHAGDTVVLGSANAFDVEPFRTSNTYVDVTYDHGYDDLPADLVGIVCQIAARVIGTSPENSGLQSESVAGYSYSLGSAAAAGAVGLLPAEREALLSFRRPASPVQQLQA